MINWLHSKFHNPNNGWDPVEASYTRAYGAGVVANAQQIRQFEGALNGLYGKRVLDLGSGPGHFALEFARLGAQVTCLDVSRNYLEMARNAMQSSRLDAKFVLGYMDNINDLTSGGFDGIFSNVSWYYCFNDYEFAKRLLAALRVGGIVMVRETNEQFAMPHVGSRRLMYWLNRRFGLKVGHPHPPQGRIEASFRAAGAMVIETDYSERLVDVVIAERVAT